MTPQCIHVAIRWQLHPKGLLLCRFRQFRRAPAWYRQIVCMSSIVTEMSLIRPRLNPLPCRSCHPWGHGRRPTERSQFSKGALPTIWQPQVEIGPTGIWPQRGQICRRNCREIPAIPFRSCAGLCVFFLIHLRPCQLRCSSGHRSACPRGTP